MSGKEQKAELRPDTGDRKRNGFAESDGCGEKDGLGAKGGLEARNDLEANMGFEAIDGLETKGDLGATGGFAIKGGFEKKGGLEANDEAKVGLEATSARGENDGVGTKVGLGADDGFEAEDVNEAKSGRGESFGTNIGLETVGGLADKDGFPGEEKRGGKTMRPAFRWMAQELEAMKRHALYRELVETAAAGQGWVVRGGRRMLNLASNDYLGLAEERSGHRGAARHGASASRLIVGNDPLLAEWEEEWAAFKGTQSSILFGSGYMANVGVIAALADRDTCVFSDRLNHASIVDGIVLSRARLFRYRHRDLDQLESMLAKAPPQAKKLIVTDAVFSMDGSVAPLRELVELKEKYGAMLMIDEAHSGGVFGAEGRGLAHEAGVTERVDVHMGTFSKAYGGYGAYVAGDRVLIDYLVNKARSLIYSTALPPMVVAAVRDNWRRALREPWRREAVRANSERFRRRLREGGLDTGLSECQIVPVMVGDNALALQFAEVLQREGIAAVAIRPPTVPEGSARIRFSLMGTHRAEDLDWAATRIIEIGRRLGIAQ